ncbi:MAG: hypothetical protein AAFO82_03855 [Bacteroidota bacterium]
MQLKKIQEHIATYKKYLAQTSNTNLHKWESQQIWQDNWDIDARDFAEMYDQSLENTTTRRIWNRENYAPKKMMLAFAKMQPHFVYSMFQELFNEDKDIGNRVDRFVFYCDELLKEYKANHPHSIENQHYHDYEIISHYLAFQYPDRYAPYRFDLFQNALEKIGSRDIPRTHDFPRHTKVTKTLYQFLSKDEELMSIQQNQLEQKHYQEKSMLLVEGFGLFLSEQ